MHHHPASWLAVVVGQKQWYFLPPNVLEMDGNEQIGLLSQVFPLDPSRWNSYVISELQKPPLNLLQCVQGPGEIILVPKDWNHATTNLADTVAFGAQVVEEGEMEEESVEEEEEEGEEEEDVDTSHIEL